MINLWHLLLSIFIAFVPLVVGFVVGMCITAKRADEAQYKALRERDEVQTCTRPAPHICRVNGPCNGLPKSAPLLPVPGRKRTGWTRYGCGCREDRYINPDKSITTERTYYNGAKEKL
jgi:hypothetical protein